MKIKKIHWLLIPALILFTFIGCNGDEPSDSPYIIGAEKYYLSVEHEKIFLYEIIGKFVVQLDTAQLFETALQKLKENPQIDYISIFSEEDYLVIVNTKLTLSKIKQQSTIINAMPAYTKDKYMPIFLTGELLLGLKEGCLIDDVRSVFENDAVVKKGGKYNNFTLQVKDWEKIFDLGNTLYHHEKVSYCHPNMTANIYRAF